MAETSKIEWTDATWPVTNGCDLHSPGCENCYAMKLAHKLGANPNTPQYAGLTEVGRHGPRWNGVVRPYAKDINQPLHWTRPRRIFVNSMSDLFHADVPFDWIDRVFATVLACQFFENRTAHTFQFLTKRSARLLEYFSASPVELLQRWTRSARNSMFSNVGALIATPQPTAERPAPRHPSSEQRGPRAPPRTPALPSRSERAHV